MSFFYVIIELILEFACLFTFDWLLDGCCVKGAGDVPASTESSQPQALQAQEVRPQGRHTVRLVNVL